MIAFYLAGIEKILIKCSSPICQEWHFYSIEKYAKKLACLCCAKTMQISVFGLTAWRSTQIQSSINGMQICTALKLEDLDGRWRIGEMQMSVLAQDS